MQANPTTKQATAVQTECKQENFAFPSLGSRKVEADFGGGNLSSDGGSLLLRQLGASARFLGGLEQCFSDSRDPELIEHSLSQMLRQRIFGLALGYEDLNDHDTLRFDPLFAAVCEREDVLGQERRCEEDRGKALAGKSTLNRLELTGSVEPSRYHKIQADPDKIRDHLLESGVQAIPRKSELIILDFDATDSIIHGAQEGRFYHGYYRDYCYLPLYCFCGTIPLWAQLRTADRDACDGAKEALEMIVAAIRKRFGPKQKILVRADSGFCRDWLLSYCEAENNLYYCTGLAKNKRLQANVMNEFAIVHQRIEEKLYCASYDGVGIEPGEHIAERSFIEFQYQTKDSWSRERRVVAKVEVLNGKENPRFIVTNIPVEGLDAGLEGAEMFGNGKGLYERVYCARGEMENRIKEQQLDMFGDRLSTHWEQSNQLRLWFSTMAYFLLDRLRTLGLAGTKLANATVGTIRLKLFKIAAQVRVSVRRVHVALCSSCPEREVWGQVFRNLKSAPETG